MWSEDVHLMYWFLGFLIAVVQDQLLLVLSPEPPGMSYKAIFRWLLLVLALELPKIGQAANQVRLLLMSGLGPLRRGRGYTEVRWWLLERF